jgi:predicted dehydrogenase
MIAARDRNRVLFSVFHNRRWDGDYMTVKQALAEGLLGRPSLFEVGSWGFGKPGGWRARPEEVGTLLHDWGAHFVDQALQLVPSRVESVRAQTQRVWADVPLERVMGPEVGRFIQTLHEAKGVVFHLGQTVTAVEPGARMAEASAPRPSASPRCWPARALP